VFLCLHHALHVWQAPYLGHLQASCQICSSNQLNCLLQCPLTGIGNQPNGGSAGCPRTEPAPSQEGVSGPNSRLTRLLCLANGLGEKEDLETLFPSLDICFPTIDKSSSFIHSTNTCRASSVQQAVLWGAGESLVNKTKIQGNLHF
jgi:hypothetical protein